MNKGKIKRSAIPSLDLDLDLTHKSQFGYILQARHSRWWHRATACGNSITDGAVSGGDPDDLHIQQADRLHVPLDAVVSDTGNCQDAISGLSWH
ncbi:hypothetical protein PoB_001426400 [Plakobranchus ocellatus]|uniref:Uncharacterized protein n=1 Tax=Plakobranchus ocellatus TaxID=259542 RepID=A0AAV3Z141_9GAST|nr:hypothetical protein PoB_001426400 [Plakobranchus ocellatus]